MILTVTLNAAIDKRYVIDGFSQGEVNPCKILFLYSGRQRLKCIKAGGYCRRQRCGNRFCRWSCR